MSDSEDLAQLTSSAETTATNGAKRGRGRPKKGQKALTTKQQTKSTIDNGVSDTNGTNGSESESSTLPKKRGRKPKAETPNKEVKSSGTVAVSGAKRGRGRPKKSPKKAGRPKKRGRAAKKSRNESDEEDNQHNDDDTGDEEDKQEDPEEDEDED